MAKDGKGVAKNLGPAVGDDGQYIVFDTEGESCCCVNDPPDPESPHCPLAKWGNITPPSDALYPYQIDPTSNIPECATITLPVGNPFAGTYLLKANNGFSVLGQSTFDAGRSWGERRTTIANGTYTMKTDNNFDSNLGEIQNDFPVWPSFEYELQFSISINSEGLLTAGIRINNLTDYRGQNPIEVAYELSNIFNQPDTDWELEAKPALNFDGTVRDSRDEWNIVASLTTNGEQYRRGNDKHGCGCEWDHRRYIDHPQLINGSTGESTVGTSWYIFSLRSYNNQLTFLDPPILQAPVGQAVPFPLEATSFGTFYGHSLDPGSKDFSIIDMEIPKDKQWQVAPPSVQFTDIIRKRIPYHFASNFSWDFELDTTAFNRFTANSPLAGLPGSANSDYQILLLFGNNNTFPLAFSEVIEQYLETGPNTAGLVKYYVAPKYAAQLHTATPPTTGPGYLNPWDKVLPNLTTGNISLTFYGLQTTNNPSLPGETPIVNNNPINLLIGLIYRIQITVNGVVIEDYYTIFNIVDDDNAWSQGEFSIQVYTPVVKWVTNWYDPEIFDQYSPGFDNDVKGGYAGSIANTAQAYEAPENCGRVVPKLLLTSQGTIDDEAGTHDIVWHVNEDIGANGTHQAFDANGSMTPDIYLYSFIGGLPPGVSISPQGEMTGTPTAEGVYNVQGFFIDFYGFTRCSWKLRIEVKVKNPAFFYPESFVSGGTNDTQADWYMRDGDSGTISGNIRWGTEPYLASYTGDALDGASFDTGNGDWVLSPLYTQLTDSSGTVTMKLIDDTNKVDFVTYDWYRSGTAGPPGP